MLLKNLLRLFCSVCTSNWDYACCNTPNYVTQVCPNFVKGVPLVNHFSRKAGQFNWIMCKSSQKKRSSEDFGAFWLENGEGHKKSSACFLNRFDSFCRINSMGKTVKNWHVKISSLAKNGLLSGL